MDPPPFSNFPLDSSGSEKNKKKEKKKIRNSRTNVSAGEGWWFSCENFARQKTFIAVNNSSNRERFDPKFPYDIGETGFPLEKERKKDTNLIGLLLEISRSRIYRAVFIQLSFESFGFEKLERLPDG